MHYLYLPFAPFYDEVPANSASEKEVTHFSLKFAASNPNVILRSQLLTPTYRVRRGEGDDPPHVDTAVAPLKLKPRKVSKAFDEDSQELVNSETVRTLTIVKPHDFVSVEGHGQDAPFRFQRKRRDTRAMIGTFSLDKSDAVFLTAVDLAHMIKQDGLNTEHRLIRLNICFGGGAFPGDAYDIGAPFGKLLALALGAINYHSIMVGGYRGESRRESGKHVTLAKPKGNWTREDRPTRDNRLYWDAEGKLLSKHEVKRRLQQLASSSSAPQPSSSAQH